MKPFIFNADLVDPVDVARRDYMEFFIDNVISYFIDKEIWNAKLSLSFK